MSAFQFLSVQGAPEKLLFETIDSFVFKSIFFWTNLHTVTETYLLSLFICQHHDDISAFDDVTDEKATFWKGSWQLKG